MCAFERSEKGMKFNMEIKVQFKEKYMDKSVIRTCVNMTKQQVINIYGLNESDIEWYKFV